MQRRQKEVQRQVSLVLVVEDYGLSMRALSDTEPAGRRPAMLSPFTNSCSLIAFLCFCCLALQLLWRVDACTGSVIGSACICVSRCPHLFSCMSSRVFILLLCGSSVHVV